ncbi:MAG: FAD-dependent oxidoreductase [Lachnospiraceae bacterium]|nr:FAD-dependent oxidoreductase [Lachnospiraceae bacterium]
MKRYVIIGNGVAAAACIEGIRSVDPQGTLTVLSEEPYEVYCRPLISYYLEGKTDAEKMKYRGADFYQENGAKVLYEEKAASIDTARKRIVTEKGNEIAYTDICIAAGSSPFVPPFEGLETVPEKYSFMTLDDAYALEKAVSEESRVLIIGAGLIGLKCAEGLKERVKEITVCDLAERVLSSILDTECAALMQEHLENNGISFLLGDSAKSFSGNKAIMNSGKEVEFDVLVLAVGVRANTQIAKEAGCEVNRGILINDRMQTSMEHIYAAGDCAEGTDITSGEHKVLAILPNAYMQGYCAGVNMAGGREVFDKGIPMNSIGFFGFHAMTAGSYYTEADGGRMYEEKTERSIKRLFTKDGFLTGFILIGREERAGIYTSMIREKIPLAEVDFDLLKRAATNAAFTEEKRKGAFSTVH